MVSPEPTDEDLHWPEPMVTVTWEHGYIAHDLRCPMSKLRLRIKFFQQNWKNVLMSDLAIDINIKRNW